MDHIRLLGFMRQLQAAVIDASTMNAERRHVWNISPGVVIMPETKCPWCSKVLRSNGIWIFSHPHNYMVLEGMVPLDTPGRWRWLYPSHPNATSGGVNCRAILCLGTYKTGMQLLAGEANLRDCPMGLQNLPAWYRQYWNHQLCPEGLEWFKNNNQLCYDAIPRIERAHLEREHLEPV